MKRIAILLLCAVLLLFLFINSWKSVRGTICDFDEKTGNLTTGFVELPSKIVYYNPDGTMHYGELLYEGHLIY